ncbi:glycogen-branching enzyme [Bdellovibrio bacteriovorus]|uniref:1,4-alpha-glucan branching enzyme GlgB n=1 Tax=Bdellovibrio bacteriovorus TaxID=959 RepID=A0A150WJC5_BDEBC|nr:1,4-alpha-glucan branching protein GlgB [Bdellovibrio bacteriovorus]KYG63800.1 glycogen-branching enzyme [Bdellovibrio bacteriovorus]
MQTILKSEDLYLFNEGSHHRSYMQMGAHPSAKEGVWFSVWAPSAQKVAVAGDFNGWSHSQHPLHVLDNSGVWSGFVRDAKIGQQYKFIVTTAQGQTLEKADPYAFYTEEPPRTASRICSLQYDWQDGEWMKNRGRVQKADQAMSIYEIHLGSWKRNLEAGGRSLTYRELAAELPKYMQEMQFTHVEMMPVMEHPFYGSWGYQTTGYFAPTSRYGTPQDFMFLVDELHRHRIGVILDWVPSHFPSDLFSLSNFDGTALFEHEDPKLGYHPDWNSLIFNYGRHEVRSFLISSALFWLDKYHIDGLRVDAVASMLYLDYSRKSGEWIPNRYGGRENLEAIEFLKDLNRAVYEHFPDVHTIAEESTAWPRVSAPTYIGGLGFGMKWDMGWMHDTLEYFSKDPIHRGYHQNQLSFRMMYAFQENFVMSISHDEVVYGKGSVYNKMSGDEWQKLANLRTLYAYMYAMPGKKLLFMGCEFAQKSEWNHESSLDWHLLQNPGHKQIQDLVRDLNHIYKTESALHVMDFEPAGFEWLDASDSHNSVYSFFRYDKDGNIILCAFNMTPIPRHCYRLGVPQKGKWREILNTDSSSYGGSGVQNSPDLSSEDISGHGRPQSLCVTLPPLGAVYLKWEKSDGH